MRTFPGPMVNSQFYRRKVVWFLVLVRGKNFFLELNENENTMYQLKNNLKNKVFFF